VTMVDPQPRDCVDYIGDLLPPDFHRPANESGERRDFSQRYDGIPRTDPGVRDSREAAISVKMILEDSCNGTGDLLLAHFVDEVSWYTFTEWEHEKIQRGMGGRSRSRCAQRDVLPDIAG
jgi:hypothetical protein